MKKIKIVDFNNPNPVINAEEIKRIGFSVCSDKEPPASAFLCSPVFKDIHFYDLHKLMKSNQRLIIYAGGIQSGKTALMEALIKDLHQHGVAVHVTEERSGFIEQTHVLFDDLTWKLRFDPAMMKGLSDLAGSLPEKVEKEKLDEPKNWLAPEQPKQKKFRSFQPDKRALNRKNRKRK